MDLKTNVVKEIGVVVVGLLFAGLVIGVEFAASCAIMCIVFRMMRERVNSYSKPMQWLLAVLSVAVVAPGSLWLTVLVAAIVASIFMFKDTSPQLVQVASLAVVGVFSAMMMIPTDAFAADSLSTMITNIQSLLKDVATAVPYAGYAAGAGFGGTGLVEIVKSKSGNGGDFGSGMKKVLVGGGLAGLGGIVDMASGDMTGEKAGTHTSPFN